MIATEGTPTAGHALSPVTRARRWTVIGRETLVGAGMTILAGTARYSVGKAAKAEPAGFRSAQIRNVSHKSGG